MQSQAAELAVSVPRGPLGGVRLAAGGVAGGCCGAGAAALLGVRGPATSCGSCERPPVVLVLGGESRLLLLLLPLVLGCVCCVWVPLLLGMGLGVCAPSSHAK